jgi:hypothetical protein
MYVYIYTYIHTYTYTYTHIYIGLIETSAYTKIRGVGFNPIYKRVLFEYSHATLGRVTIAKGLPTKVMNTGQ